jgi:phage replication-related protein YjqB (UPF0714/DUF867 family)
VIVLDDRYSDFDELSRNEREGVDFRICLTRRDSPVAIIAPHGGRIEFGTSQAAAAIAGEMYSLYCFEGLKPHGNRALHIPSTNFHEPKCMELISTCDIVVSVHGLKGKHEAIDVGGLDNELRDAICRNLNNAGFEAKIVTSGSHAAVSQRNISNRGRLRTGVQLEITKGLRGTLLTRSQSLTDLEIAVQSAIDRLRGVRL